MNVLWAPWRMEYILGPKPGDCVFCLPSASFAPSPHGGQARNSFTEEEKARLVLYKGKTAFTVMNTYPYASGHLLVVPYRHVADVTDLCADENAEIMDMVQKACVVLRDVSAPQGINVGLNLGEAAGAGIRSHVHFHVVPRWVGDSSFMAVFDDVRVIPEHLKATYTKLFEAYKRLFPIT